MLLNIFSLLPLSIFYLLTPFSVACTFLHPNTHVCLQISYFTLPLWWVDVILFSFLVVIYLSIISSLLYYSAIRRIFFHCLFILLVACYRKRAICVIVFRYVYLCTFIFAPYADCCTNFVTITFPRLCLPYWR